MIVLVVMIITAVTDYGKGYEMENTCKRLVTDPSTVRQLFNISQVRSENFPYNRVKLNDFDIKFLTTVNNR